MSLDELSSVIAQEVASVGTLRIELDSIGDFYPTLPLIYWEVRPNLQLNRLYRSLYAKLNLPLPHKQYLPHVTLAREISAHRVLLVKEKIVPYLARESFQAAAVDLISPVAGERWVSVRTFPLPQEQD